MKKETIPFLVLMASATFKPAYADQQNILVCEALQTIEWISDTSQIGSRQVDPLGGLNQPPPYSQPWQAAVSEATLVFSPIDDEAELAETVWDIQPNNITHRVVGSTDWVGSSIKCSITNLGIDGLYGRCFESASEQNPVAVEIWQAGIRSQVEYIYRSPELSVPSENTPLDASLTIIEYGRCELF